MAKSNEWREKRSAEEAAAETEEPAAAARARAEDDAATRAKQDKAEAGLREADRALEAGGARLRHTRAELERREEELERTSDLTREVAQNAVDLRAQTAEIAEETHRMPSRRTPTES